MGIASLLSRLWHREKPLPIEPAPVPLADVLDILKFVDKVTTRQTKTLEELSSWLKELQCKHGLKLDVVRKGDGTSANLSKIEDEPVWIRLTISADVTVGEDQDDRKVLWFEYSNINVDFGLYHPTLDEDFQEGDSYPLSKDGINRAKQTVEHGFKQYASWTALV